MGYGATFGILGGGGMAPLPPPLNPPMHDTPENEPASCFPLRNTRINVFALCGSDVTWHFAAVWPSFFVCV